MRFNMKKLFAKGCCSFLNIFYTESDSRNHLNLLPKLKCVLIPDVGEDFHSSEAELLTLVYKKKRDNEKRPDFNCLNLLSI